MPRWQSLDILISGDLQQITEEITRIIKGNTTQIKHTVPQNNLTQLQRQLHS